MRNNINITWEDALLDNEDATELDRNTQLLLESIPQMGAGKEEKNYEQSRS